jgi:glycosyltransferase involved in cell wall biosynthesis
MNTAKHIKISAAIITFNEEKNIRRCLDSLRGIVDETVVVDSFSTDKTEEICRTYNVRFVQHAFDGHIQQKNRALDLTSNNYVLSLDADEALSSELQQAVSAIKKAWNADGYRFNRLNNYCGRWIRHCGWYPDTKLRLWDKRKGRWGGINPHDTVIMEKDATVKRISGNLLHYTYYTISEHVLQANKFSDIMANGYYRRGVKASVVKIIYKTLWSFFRSYFLRLGFLDGFYGLVVCNITAFTTFLKYVKLRNLHRERKKI